MCLNPSGRTFGKPDPRVFSSNIITLTETIKELKTLDPTMKHQQSIPEKLVLHIYRQTNTHLKTSTEELIAGTSFFFMRSYK